ncbi:MAG: HEAT repeat domain-containing protein [Planctomycetes bacterium]|nr:HEAT repeat domain-containing protein [Planctomycetota bacterium]
MNDRFNFCRVLALAACALGVCVLPASVHGQDLGNQVAGEDVNPLRLLDDFEHYVVIQQREMAAAVGQQLLDLGLTPREFLDLVKSTRDVGRFLKAVDRTASIAELEGIGAQMRGLFRRGEMELVRDPSEISRNISLLTANNRARWLATERLVAAGEYATPQLLEALLGDDGALSAEAVRVLAAMNRHAIMPLSTALLGLDPVSQEKVISVLGRIDYRTSLPFLAQVVETTESAPVRQAGQRALRRIGGDTPSAAVLYLDLANGFFDERSDLTSFPDERIQLLWDYDPRSGLFPRAIITELFHEAMSMRMAEASLLLDAESRNAVALWVSANLRRELETPEAYENPVYASSRHGAQYYAIAAGADVCQRVLARALVDRNTRLVRSAIAALTETAGGDSLWSFGGLPAPLLSALRYPNRRVQYESALALARADAPTFEGSDRVVPILAATLRHASEKYAIVIERGAGTEGARRRALQELGYKVLRDARSLSEIAGQISETPGIDLVVCDLTDSATRLLIEEVHGSPLLSATPVLALVSAQGAIDLGYAFRRDELVAIRSRGIDESMFRAITDELVERASGGPISPAEGRDYQSRALAALRDLAIAGGGVYRAEDAGAPLIRALHDAGSPFRLQVATVLSHIGQRPAQVALMDAALGASGPERIAFMQRVSASAKRYGNMLQPGQVVRLIGLVTNAADEEATAAAALMGSLSLDNERLVPLILNEGG